MGFPVLQTVMVTFCLPLARALDNIGSDEIHIAWRAVEDLKHICITDELCLRNGIPRYCCARRVEDLSGDYLVQLYGSVCKELASRGIERRIVGGGNWMRIGPAVPARIVQNEPGFLTCIRSLERGAGEWRNAVEAMIAWCQ